jgi:hypothetical protein
LRNIAITDEEMLQRHAFPNLQPRRFLPLTSVSGGGTLTRWHAASA